MAPTPTGPGELPAGQVRVRCAAHPEYLQDHFCGDQSDFMGVSPTSLPLDVNSENQPLCCLRPTVLLPVAEMGVADASTPVVVVPGGTVNCVDTVAYDNAGIADLSTGTFTIQKEGIYNVSLNIAFSDTIPVAGNMQVGILIVRPTGTGNFDVNGNFDGYLSLETRDQPSVLSQIFNGLGGSVKLAAGTVIYTVINSTLFTLTAQRVVFSCAWIAPITAIAP